MSLSRESKISEEQRAAHEAMINAVYQITGSNTTVFKSATEELEAGLQNSQHYDRAVRRLCHFVHPKSLTLIQAILPYRFKLHISFTTQNKDGLSALDLCKNKNPAIYALIQKTIHQDMLDITLSMAPPLLEKPKEGEPFHSGVQLNSEQKTALTTSTQQIRDFLTGAAFDQICKNAGTMSDEKMHDQIKDSVQTLLMPNLEKNASVFPSHEPFTTDQPGAPLIKALMDVSQGDDELKPFIAHCEAKEYENALRFAAKSKNQKMVPMLEVLRKRLTLNISAMVDNPEKRSPLHAAALEKNWLVYYQMVGMGANSRIRDHFGKTAAEYRQERQLASGSTRALISDILAGANRIESSIAENNQDVPGCRQG